MEKDLLLFDQQPNQKTKKYKLDVSRTAPWIKKSTLKIKNPLTKLHNEIIEFYNYITPSEEEHNHRTRVISIFRFSSE